MNAGHLFPRSAQLLFEQSQNTDVRRAAVGKSEEMLNCARCEKILRLDDDKAMHVLPDCGHKICQKCAKTGKGRPGKAEEGGLSEL